jgi:type II secretory pathway pseudopilin PulG
MRSDRTIRGGMTLVELLVAAALCLVIMAILASTFATGTDTLRQLKSAGDMQRYLRAAGEKIKADLAAPHFDDPAVSGGKLSNVRFDQSLFAYPAGGVVRVVQVGSAYQEFLQDPNAVQYFPSKVGDYTTIASPAKKAFPNGANVTLSPINGVTTYQGRPNGNAHALQLSVKLDGKTRQTIFTAPRPDTVAGAALDNKYDNLVPSQATYATRWAVVNYFLLPPIGNPQTLSGSPLFNLYRRVQLLAEVPGAELNQSSPTFPAAVQNFSTRVVLDVNKNPHVLVNTTADLTLVGNRPAAFVPIGDGSDIVLTNVTSFEIKANWVGGFRKLTAVPTFPGDLPNFDYPYDDFPPPNQAALGGSSNYDNNPRIFDTAFPAPGQPFPLSPEPALGVPTTVHTRVRVTGFQIKLRVWDPNQRGARQVTLVQDM